MYANSAAHAMDIETTTRSDEPRPRRGGWALPLLSIAALLIVATGGGIAIGYVTGRQSSPTNAGVGATLSVYTLVLSPGQTITYTDTEDRNNCPITKPDDTTISCSGPDGLAIDIDGNALVFVQPYIFTAACSLDASNYPDPSSPLGKFVDAGRTLSKAGSLLYNYTAACRSP